MAANTSAELDGRREQPSDRAVRAWVVGPHGPQEISPLFVVSLIAGLVVFSVLLAATGSVYIAWLAIHLFAA